MVNVIGLGYIGLPTALMMASHGVEVIGTDYNKELVATLNAGKTTLSIVVYLVLMCRNNSAIRIGGGTQLDSCMVMEA